MSDPTKGEKKAAYSIQVYYTVSYLNHELRERREEKRERALTYKLRHRFQSYTLIRSIEAQAFICLLRYSVVPFLTLEANIFLGAHVWETIFGTPNLLSKRRQTGFNIRPCKGVK